MDNRKQDLDELYGYGTAILELLNSELQERDKKIAVLSADKEKFDQLRENIQKIMELRCNIKELLDQ